MCLEDNREYRVRHEGGKDDYRGSEGLREIGMGAVEMLEKAQMWSKWNIFTNP